MSRWPVLLEHAVGPEDLDAEGRIRDDVVERWVDDVCAAYLEHCVVLAAALEREGLRVRSRTVKLPHGERLGHPTEVVVSAGATEILPESFTIAVRLRPFGGEREVALNGARTIQLEDPATGEVHPVTNDIRDELIALAHAARHFN